MNTSRNILTILSICIALAACDPGSQRPIDTKAIREEIENRKPKRVREGQIIEKAYELGRTIADTAQTSLQEYLKQAIKEKGVAGAVEYCNLEILPLMDSLSKAYNAKISRTSLHLLNTKNAPDSLEFQLLDAYQYNIENHLPLTDNVATVGEKYLLYTKPIVVENALCLNCHGKVGEEINKETLEKLDQLYPADSARNHKLGDLRGMWSILLSRKEIVNSL